MNENAPKGDTAPAEGPAVHPKPIVNLTKDKVEREWSRMQESLLQN